MPDPDVAEQFDGHRLREKVAVRGTGKGLDFSAIERAEAALGKLSVNFDDWTDEEVARLLAAHAKIAKHGYAGEFADEFFRVAHDLKGEAVTFGYPLITSIAGSLCLLLEKCDAASVPMSLVTPHVDAIRAIARDKVKGEVNNTALALANSLATLTEDFIAARRQAKPAASAGT